MLSRGFCFHLYDLYDQANDTDEGKLSFHLLGFRGQHFGHAKPQSNKDVSNMKCITTVKFLVYR